MQSSSAGRSIRSYRRIAEVLQALLILGIPFIRVNGGSLLRFDLTTFRLEAFGQTIWVHELFLILVASITLILLTILATVVFGRVWCGWLCPQTVLVDFTPFMERFGKKGIGGKAASSVATLLISVLVAASLIWYFISPYEFLPALVHGRLGGVTTTIWAVLTVVLFLDFAILRHRWCATVCPYAKIQSVLFDRSTLILELDPARAAECIDCKGCLRVCPTGVDIRKGLDVACINCAECLDACTAVMARSGKRGLIRYAFGPGGGGSLVRQNAVMAGGFFLLFFALTLHLFIGRTGVDVAVLPHIMGPRITNGRIVNAYVLAVDNMRSEPIDLTVSVERFDPSLVQSATEPLHLAAERHDLFPLFVRITRPESKPGTRQITITLDDRAHHIHIVKEANFTIPDAL